MDKLFPMARRIVKGGIALLIVLLVVGAAAGCRRAPAPEPGVAAMPGSPVSPGEVSPDEVSSDGIHISLIAPVFPPPAGDGHLAFRVTDTSDRPIDTATLQIRGDMTHAGMLPIEATAAADEDGVYRTPIRWTMAGDWIITVEATLSDGRRATRSFNVKVTGEEELCIDDL